MHVFPEDRSSARLALQTLLPQLCASIHKSAQMHRRLRFVAYIIIYVIGLRMCMHMKM